MISEEKLVVRSPVDDAVFFETDLADLATLELVLERARLGARAFRAASLEERVAAVTAWLDRVEAEMGDAAEELTTQMGRPRGQTGGELAGFLDRGRTMARLAPEVLGDHTLPTKEGFSRYIRREPLGVVLVLSPWNYPWLTAVNAIAPALLAGNSVVLKHAEQTPLVAERMTRAWRDAGLPPEVFQHVHMTHARTAEAIRDPRVGAVAFTGSVPGGIAVSRAAVERFIPVGLELGGKDAAYVRADADVARAAAHIVDGGMFNAGQSCCAVERVYVDDRVADAFIEAAVAEAKALRMGDPREESTTLGPLVRARNADAVRAQLGAARAAGARALVDAASDDSLPRQYLAPEILVDVNHEMAFMCEETFGPALGIMPVRGDEEALSLINDSAYGLTASIWTPDLERAEALGAELNVGTVFMNRADYLDPELAWTGVGDSGRGVTLSRFGFDGFTRLKSFHLRHRIP